MAAVRLFYLGGAAFRKLGTVEEVNRGPQSSAYDAAAASMPLGATAYLGGFSAGCAGVRRYVQMGLPATVKGVAVLDGVHAPAGVSASAPASSPYLAPWVRLLRSSADGTGPRVFWTSSAIVPPTFDSTRAVLNRVMRDAFGEEPPASGTWARGGLRVVTTSGDNEAEHHRHAAMASEAAAWLGSDAQGSTAARSLTWLLFPLAAAAAWWRSRNSTRNT